MLILFDWNAEETKRLRILFSISDCKFGKNFSFSLVSIFLLLSSLVSLTFCLSLEFGRETVAAPIPSQINNESVLLTGQQYHIMNLSKSVLRVIFIAIDSKMTLQMNN